MLLTSLCSLAATDLAGQSSLEVGSGSVGLGETATVEITLSTLDAVQGWSFGLCHQENELSVVEAQLGSAAIALNSGAGPDYSQISLENGGVTVGGVVCFAGCEVLGPGIDLSLAEVTYGAVTQGGADCSIDFCATLGSPPINVVVTVGAESIVPTTTGGVITVERNTSFRAAEVEGVPGQQVAVPILLTSPVGLSGIQVACAYDPIHLFFIDAIPSGVTTGADFFTLQDSEVPGEIGVGVIQDLSPPLDQLVPQASDAPMMEFHFFLSPLVDVGATIPIEFATAVGSPPLQNRVVLGTLFDSPNLVSGSITVIEQANFIRGDCNGDELTDLADPIRLLTYLFVAGGGAPGCLDACDNNDDGATDASDAIHIIAFLFSDGAPPPAPHPSRGPDPTEDTLDCFGS